MMSSTTTKQPVKMPLIYSPACTLSSTQSKQRSQEAKWTALTAISDSCWEECVYFGLSLLSFSFSLPPLLITARYRLDQCWLLWLLEGECVTWPGGKAKAGPSSLQYHWLQRKSSLRRHNRRLEEVGVVIWGKAGVKRALRVRNVPAAGCQDTEITHNKTARHSCTLPSVAAWPAGHEQARQPREVI